MTWNHAGTDGPEEKVTARRERLHVALSDDDGKTWSAPVVAATAGEVSYPFLLETLPGQSLVTSGRLRAKGMTTDVIALRVAERALRR